MSITINKYYSEDKKIWNDFLSDSKNGLFMFHRNYMDYHRDRFEDHSLMFYDEEKLVALLPLNIKENVLYSHGGLTFGGFITNARMRAGLMLECFDSLREYMNANNLKRLVYKAVPHIYHQYPAEEDLYALFRNQAHILKIEPSTTIDISLPIKISRGRKAHIKHAEKFGIEVHESMDFQSYICLLNETLLSRHNTKAVHNAEEIELLHNYFPENIKLFIAVYKQKILAGTLIFIYPNLIHTQYLASSDEGCEFSALDLIITTLIEKYRYTKRYFDFGISTEDSGRILNEGLIQQKETFGGRTTVHQTFDLIVE